jgi:hypothetical protein
MSTYVVRVGTKVGATRAFIFKLVGSETAQQAAQAFADSMAQPLLLVMPAADFIGQDFYELESV